MARRPLIAANWKMNKSIAEARDFCERLLPRLGGRDEGGAEVVVCPPYLALPAVVEACAGAPVGVAAQNMYFEGSGAYTGEVSATMLRDAGADGVILGHSERRQLFGESDEALSRKVPAALAAGLLRLRQARQRRRAARSGGDRRRVGRWRVPRSRRFRRDRRGGVRRRR